MTINSVPCIQQNLKHVYNETLYKVRMASSLMMDSVYLETTLNCLEKSVCPTPTQQKLPETWEQPPHTHSHPSTASLTTGAFALAVPGEVTVCAPSWRNQISRN